MSDRGRIVAACIVSVLLHCSIIVFLPIPVVRKAQPLIVRSMAFIRKDVVDPIRASAVPKTDNRPALDRVVRVEPLQVRVSPAPMTPEQTAARAEKLKFADKIERRPGGKSDNPPRFQELVRRRISASCDKNMSKSVRALGGRLEKIVVLTVTILPSGELELVHVVESSNLPAIDRASVEAVKLAAPFPKFPSDLGLLRLKLRVPIRFVLSGGAG